VEIFQGTASQPMVTFDIGKSGIERDGSIVVNLTDLLAPMPSNATLYADIVAVGPGGIARSNMSSAFTFNDCRYVVTPDLQSISGAGGNGSLSVSTGAGCNWVAASTADWITFTTPTGGSGSGAVAFSVVPNSATVPRTGVLVVANQTPAVNEGGAVVSEPTTPPTNIPPSVTISSPVSGTSVSMKTAVDIAVSARDADGSVARVDLLVDGNVVNSTTTAPYSFRWDATQGTHTLTAIAVDDLGGQAGSAPVTISVSRKNRK
jgi:hypothetical protein